MPDSKAREEFCKKYNNKKVLADDVTLRAIINGISPKTLFSWESNYKKDGLVALAGSYGNRKGETKIDSNKELKDHIWSLLYQYPNITNANLMAGLRCKFKNDILWFLN